MSYRGAEDEEAGGKEGGANLQMCLWCLNPALAFNAMADPAHAIILTSGTLAPMATFASEVSHALHHKAFSMTCTQAQSGFAAPITNIAETPTGAM